MSGELFEQTVVAPRVVPRVLPHEVLDATTITAEVRSLLVLASRMFVANTKSDLTLNQFHIFETEDRVSRTRSAR